MKKNFQHALLDAVGLLRDLPRERHAREAVRERMQRFSTTHQNVPCDLLVNQPPGSNAASYDLLLGLPEGGTLAVSFCPESGDPWTVEFSDHWAANYVLSVNGLHTSIQSALIYLRSVLNRQPDLMLDLVNRTLIQQAIDADPPAVTTHEVEKAVDNFRLRHGLHKAEAMRQWLEEMGLTLEAMRDLMTHNVRAGKLKKRVTAGKVREYFQAHRAGFDVVTLCRVESLTLAPARSLARAARARELGQALLDSAGKIASLSGRWESLYAYELSPALGSARQGEIVGPERAGSRYWVAQAVQRRAARLTAGTRGRIESLLFEAWLAERRKQAAIRWHWV